MTTIRPRVGQPAHVTAPPDIPLINGKARTTASCLSGGMHAIKVAYTQPGPRRLSGTGTHTVMP
ncbi:hypothetical protein ABZ330_20385 [Streptomyces sp. NPDC006172]|uniref:hypothetical protein n=1 Tax=Streptomyces sp. NPDC006172 TaxID=3154470 RepID=UPI0033DF5789